MRRAQKTQITQETPPAARQKHREIRHLLIYIVLFFAMQTSYAYIYTISPYLQSDVVLQIAIRLATWTVPVIIYLIVTKKNPFDYLKLRKNILKGLIWGLGYSLILGVLNVAGNYILKGKAGFNFNIGSDFLWKAIILVGFSEEVLFRGFFLQKMEGVSRFWAANIIGAILFVLVHFPGWIFLNQFVLPNILGSIAYILVFGLIQGIILKKADSLWACMLIHSFSNLYSVMIF